MVKIIKLVLGLTAITLISGCQSPPLNVHYEMDNVSFDTYQTVQVQSMNKPANEKIQIVTAAIEDLLKQKGYRVSEESDLILAYDIRLSEDSQLRIDQIPYKGNVATRTRLEAVYQAAFLINAIDQKDQNVVWKAFTEKDIHHTKEDKIDPERLNRFLTEIFASFPEGQSSSSGALN